jgi:hypothetical protein
MAAQTVKPNRVRIRIYYGSTMEFLYQLISFGIPKIAAPIGDDGKPNNLWCLRWIKRKMEAEGVPDDYFLAPSTKVDVPTIVSTSAASGSASSSCGGRTVSSVPTGCALTDATIIEEVELRNDDVLLGKEKKMVNHPGNIRFRQLIDIYIGSYESAPRGEKGHITKLIVDQVRSSNGRFLRREKGGGGRDGKDAWVVVDDETAHDKITHAFRNRRKYHSTRASSTRIV